jgi:hypothetical protein
MTTNDAQRLCVAFDGPHPVRPGTDRYTGLVRIRTRRWLTVAVVKRTILVCRLQSAGTVPSEMLEAELLRLIVDFGRGV